MIRFSATRSVITEASEDFMIIHVDTSGSVRLDEPDTFTAFHVRAPGQKLVAALAALGEDAFSAADEHVWIAIPRLHALGEAHGGPGWREGCDGMLGYAASQGWIDAARNAVRGHLET